MIKVNDSQRFQRQHVLFEFREKWVTLEIVRFLSGEANGRHSHESTRLSVEATMSSPECPLELHQHECVTRDPGTDGAGLRD